jgi:hypothetical protein
VNAVFAEDVAFVVMNINLQTVFFAVLTVDPEENVLMMTVQRFKVRVHPAYKTMRFVRLNY